MSDGRTLLHSSRLASRSEPLPRHTPCRGRAQRKIRLHTGYCIPLAYQIMRLFTTQARAIWYHDPTGPSYMRTAAYRSSACRRSYMYPRMGMYRRRARAASRDHTTFDHMQCSTCTTGIMHERDPALACCAFFM